MLDKFLEEINELKEAKALLDHILGGYNVYDKTFNFNDTNKFPDPELESKIGHEKAREAKYTWKTDAEVLNNRIRNYIKFDDSE
jgi:hypothetical protein